MHKVEPHARLARPAFATWILLISSIGAFSLSAGSDARITGSDLVAGKNLSLSAKSITFDPGIDQSKLSESHQISQSGLSIGVSGGVVGLAQSIASQAKGISEANGDQRVIALRGVTAAVQGQELLKTLDAMGKATDLAGVASASGASLSISLGSAQSKSVSTASSTTNSGATALAGGNLKLKATGGDITATGATLAGQNVSLSRYPGTDHDIANRTINGPGSTSINGPGST